MNRRFEITACAVLTAVALSVSSGCVYKIPERKYYREVLNMDYIENKFDCTGKTELYKNRLKEKGYDARHVMGIYPAQAGSINHSWVEYTDNNGITRLIDPTIKATVSGFPTSYYPDYRGIFFAYLNQDHDTATASYSVYQ